MSVPRQVLCVLGFGLSSGNGTMTVCLRHLSAWKWPRQAICLAGYKGCLAGKPILGTGWG